MGRNPQTGATMQIAASKVPGNKNSVDFTYSVWIYIKDLGFWKIYDSQTRRL